MQNDALEDRKSKRDGAPPCGLWLRVGPDLALDVLLKDLKQIFFVVNNGSAYTRNMHTLEISGRADDSSFAEKASILVQLAQAAGFAAILRGDAAAAQAIGADGVLLTDIADVPAAKALFGDEGIVGLHCGIAQERAAAAYDAGVDFVMFGTGKNTLPGPEALRFWAILTDKPAVIEGPLTNDYCAYFIEAGASFIDGSDYIFSHGKGLMQATSNLLYAIEHAIPQNPAAGGATH